MALLRWALIFAVIAVIAALFGFTELASDFAGVARFLFFLFVGIVALLVIGGVFLYKKIT